MVTHTPTPPSRPNGRLTAIVERIPHHTNREEMAMKTRVHYYQFSTPTPEYHALLEQIKSQFPEARGHWLNCLADPRTTDRTKEHGHVEEVEIDPACLFENQWNTTTARIFDHYEGIYDNKKVKSGHWTEITPEMAEARRLTLKCGYCGKHYGPHHEPAPEDGFCTACMDSQYIEKKDLKLTRLHNLIEADKPKSHSDRYPELTEQEAAILIPRYIHAQTIATGSRAVAKAKSDRKRVEEKRDKAIDNAKQEAAGMLQLLDLNYPIDNVIYYSHTDTFCFGWIKPLCKEELDHVLGFISEFHHKYDILTDDKRKLSGNYD